MKILLPVDGSDYTKRMLAYIAAHDEWLGAHHSYTVIHSVLAVPHRAAAFVEQNVVRQFYESDAEIVMPPELLAVVLLAGPCAEAHVRGLRADRMFDGVAATQDREAMAVLGLSEQQFIAATKEALAIVERDWALIEKVAEGLADHERLDYEDVEFIVVAENQASN